MINQLCKIPFVKRAVLGYAFNNQIKPKDEQFARMEFKFLDSEGKRYYRYYDNFDLPVARMEQLQIKLREIESRINGKDLDEWLEATEKILSKPKKEKACIEAIQMLGALKERRKVLYDPDLFMRAVCIMYIREDQDPCIWDEALEEQKFQRLMTDKAGGLYDFFYMSGLSNYLPSLEDMESGWQSFSDNQMQQMEAFTKMVASVNGTLEPESITS